MPRKCSSRMILVFKFSLTFCLQDAISLTFYSFFLSFSLFLFCFLFFLYLTYINIIFGACQSSSQHKPDIITCKYSLVHKYLDRDFLIILVLYVTTMNCKCFRGSKVFGLIK